MLNESLDISRVAADLSLPVAQVSEAIELLDAGNTVPFITRFRKDATGGLNEIQLRSLQHRLAQLRGLSEKRQTILRALEKRGHLTEQLRARIAGASSGKLLEDLYQPFRYKRTSQVQQAREMGLHPLAEAVYLQGLTEADFEHEVAQTLSSTGEPLDRDVVLRGVKALLGEYFSNHLKLKQSLRRTAWKTGILRCQQIVGDSATAVAETQEVATVSTQEIPSAALSVGAPATTAAPLSTVRRRKRKKKRRQDVLFRAYFNFSEPLHRLPPYRILAINRGERSKQLRVRIELNESSLLEQMCREVVPESHPLTQLMNEAARELLTRSLIPALEREIRRELTEKAEEHAVKVFSTNLRGLLLQPPTIGKRVLAVDPGLKSGCTLAVIDQHGNFVTADKISIVGRDEKRQSAGQKILAMIEEHLVDVIVIGNGTGCRESEELIAKLLSTRDSGREVRYVIVNEAGASVYSTSETGQSEFPNVEPTVRSAISIGRRLLDPLSELVKINPANIGVGLYQHDVKSKHLESTLAEVVESCVNYVGVDLNTASVDLLRYVAGLNQGTARRIIEYRQEHGPFTSRQQLLQIPGVGPATYVQCAGFLRITGGEQPLDATAIHPESYPIAEVILESLGVTSADIGAVLRREVSMDEWVKKLEQFDPAGLTAKLAAAEPVGEHLKCDLLDSLKRPGRDPREQMPTPIFRKGILQVQDLTVGMALKGQVLNVVDFGVFVDIGIGESGLVHISNLAREYVRDPHQYFAVGDIVDVWVQSIDRKRGRVSLTAIDPTLPPLVLEDSRESAHKQRQSGGSKPAKSARIEARTRPESGHKQSPQRHQAPKAAASERRTPDKKSADSQSNRAKRNRPKYGDRKPNRDRVAAKPSVPITDGMIQGTEPMRSFSDLLQYAKLAAKTQQDT